MDMPYDPSAVQGMWAVNIPVVDVFNRPGEDVAFQQFRLVPDKLTGQKEAESQNGLVWGTDSSRASITSLSTIFGRCLPFTVDASRLPTNSLLPRSASVR